MPCGTEIIIQSGELFRTSSNKNTHDIIKKCLFIFTPVTRFPQLHNNFPHESVIQNNKKNK